MNLHPRGDCATRSPHFQPMTGCRQIPPEFLPTGYTLTSLCRRVPKAVSRSFHRSHTSGKPFRKTSSFARGWI